MQEVDDKFYKCADAHILKSNDQISEMIGHGKVSASMMYATSRFNAWVTACGWRSSEEPAKAKEEAIEYFVSDYRNMLAENLDDYIENFD